MFVYKFVTRFTRTFWQYVKPIHMFIVTTLGPGALIIVYNTYKTGTPFHRLFNHHVPK